MIENLLRLPSNDIKRAVHLKKLSNKFDDYNNMVFIRSDNMQKM